jgi:hypothetical protein
MPRYHNINGNRVQFTEAEELARDLPEGLTTVEDVEAVTFPTKP